MEKTMSPHEAPSQRRQWYPEQPQRPRRYLLANKPYDVLSEFNDPEDRPTLADFVSVPGLEPAGRLDQDSEGLLVLTDDGELAHQLTHPDYHLPKTYLVQVEGVLPADALQRLRQGVSVKGETTDAAEVELLERAPDLPPRARPVRDDLETSWLRMVIREGKKRQIRHMTAAVGHPTLRLVRVAIGPITLRGLAPGEWRDMEESELARLRRILRDVQAQQPAPRKQQPTAKPFRPFRGIGRGRSGR